MDDASTRLNELKAALSFAGLSLDDEQARGALEGILRWREMAQLARAHVTLESEPASHFLPLSMPR
ncbi:MAG: hypothetical protein KGJ86_09535 [Chloroflexota bacterium]|nr:hypothetical protein [Chloroflexota bacterium]